MKDHTQTVCTVQQSIEILKKKWHLALQKLNWSIATNFTATGLWLYWSNMQQRS